MKTNQKFSPAENTVTDVPEKIILTLQDRIFLMHIFIMAGLHISRNPAKFNAYIVRTNNYLQALVDPIVPGVFNWTRLGLTSQNAVDWAMKTLVWTGAPPNLGLYSKYTDPTLKTTNVITQTNQFIKDFRTPFGRDILRKIIASDNANAADAVMFNVVLNPANPSHTHTKIAESCLTTFNYVAAGNYKAESRSATDTKRASVPAGIADGVQYFYQILDAGQTPPESPDANGVVMQFFTGATHEIPLGIGNINKYLYVWTRWYSAAHPTLAGNFSAMQTIHIGIA